MGEHNHRRETGLRTLRTASYTRRRTLYTVHCTPCTRALYTRALYTRTPYVHTYAVVHTYTVHTYAVHESVHTRAFITCRGGDRGLIMGWSVGACTWAAGEGSVMRLGRRSAQVSCLRRKWIHHHGHHYHHQNRLQQQQQQLLLLRQGRARFRSGRLGATQGEDSTGWVEGGVSVADSSSLSLSSYAEKYIC